MHSPMTRSHRAEPDDLIKLPKSSWVYLTRYSVCERTPVIPIFGRCVRILRDDHGLDLCHEIVCYSLLEIQGMEFTNVEQLSSTLDC